MNFLVMTALALAQSPSDDEIRGRVVNTRVSLIEFDNAPIKEVADRIGELTSLNVILRGVDSTAVQPVTITLTGVTLESVLGLILDDRKLTWIVEDGIVYVINVVDRPKVLDMYDVRDMLMPITSFPGIDINLATDSLGVVTTPSEESEAASVFSIDVLMELIKAQTGAGTWEEPGNSISNTGDILVVKTTKETHAQIQRFMAQLRKTM